MSIHDKIKKIRQKPEHIRARYAWFFAISGTLLVVFVWFMSLRASQTEIKKPQLNEEQLQVFKDLGEQKKSMQEMSGKVKESLENQREKTEL